MTIVICQRRGSVCRDSAREKVRKAHSVHACTSGASYVSSRVILQQTTCIRLSACAVSDYQWSVSISDLHKWCRRDVRRQREDMGADTLQEVRTQMTQCARTSMRVGYAVSESNRLRTWWAPRAVYIGDSCRAQITERRLHSTRDSCRAQTTERKWQGTNSLLIKGW